MEELPKAWVLIDMGYLSFYRYHAAKKWLGFRTDADQTHPWTNESQFRDTLLRQYEKNLKKLIKGKQALLAMESLDNKNWRREIYTAYKAQRPKNTDIYTYFKYLCTEFLPKFCEENSDCTMIRLSGTEADDIIALKALELSKKKPIPEISIITSDMDFLQLVEKDNTITLYDQITKSKVTNH